MKSRKGWLRLRNIDKFKRPVDGYMQSFKQIGEGYFVQYKSSLEAAFINYADNNPKIVQWSLEPFAIPYISPKDGRSHRYFPDAFVEFDGGAKVLVEIKSNSETKPPRKNDKRYVEKMQTFAVNQVKWKTASGYCQQKGISFVVLTEDQLKPKK